ncbi:MAG: alkaline phosphatase family protein [Acidobacteriota bacterium]
MMNKKTYASLVSLLLITLFVVSNFSLATQNRRANERASTVVSAKPKLVLVIVVDQFRYDFLERFADLLGRDGFRRLIEGGAFFTNANYDYVPTYTAPGHASIFTGSVPAQNGIVGNNWFDRETGKNRVMVSDLNARSVTMKGISETPGSFSPRVLIGTTIGDQIRLSNNFKSKVIAVSQKDRSAILPGGQKPNGAFWYQASDGTFITSDYYASELPAWVKAFNTNTRPDKYFNMKWELSAKPEIYSRAQSQNLPIQKSPLGDKFPYAMNAGEAKPTGKFYSAFEYSPYASEHLAEFAEAAIDAEKLGEDEYPDLLSVSFSSPDLIGHAFGPDSREIVDTYIRLDQTIAGLLNFIDRKVGLANTVIAVTGDHGVCPVPEYAKSVGFDADRIPGTRLIETVNKALTKKFGEGKWVQAFVNDQLYLDPKVIAQYKADASEVERSAGEAAITVPGVVNFFTRTQITEGDLPTTPIGRRVMNGFNRKRSGDVWIIAKPFYFFMEGTLPTTHGSPYNYDTHVPIIFWGKSVQKGRFSIDCAPSDIAPTLASILGVEMPSNRVGRVLPVQDK